MTLRTDLSWVHDTRDNVLYPNKGVMQRLSGEIGLPGLDLEYYKISYQHTWYKDVTKNITFMLNGEGGFGDSYGSKDFPFFKNFYAGGVSSVRGYRTSYVGPKDLDVSGREFAVGGTRRVVGNAELFFPVPLLRDAKQFRLSAFMDAGSVWGQEGNAPDSCSGASDCMRYSTGVGVSWYSPFGPIKVVLAKPLNDKDGDKTQTLQFHMGSQF